MKFNSGAQKALFLSYSLADCASSPPAILVQPSSSGSSLSAGGFEWEDPTDQFDQGVENPFKNPEILNAKEGEGEEGMKIDPARLLGPRLQGSNLYFVGMMGSGKSAVGDIVARSECSDVFWLVLVWCGGFDGRHVGT